MITDDAEFTVAARRPRTAVITELLLRPAGPPLRYQARPVRAARRPGRSAADLLARAAAGEQPMSLAQVGVAVRDFVAQFERHLPNEEDLLASAGPPESMPGTRGDRRPAPGPEFVHHHA